MSAGSPQAESLSNMTVAVASRVCVVGGDSRIGHALAQRLAAQGTHVQVTSRAPGTSREDHLDLAAPDAWAGPTAGTDVAFLCAAITDMRRCAEQPDEARRVNVEATASLARRMAGQGVRVVLLSTNAVFSGDVADPPETAVPDPRVDYGRLKLEAERHVLSLGDLGVVVRLVKVLSADLPLLAGWRRQLLAGETVSPFRDLRMAPVSMAYAVGLLLRVANERLSGVLHASGETSVDYGGFLKAYAVALGLPPDRITPVAAAEAGVTLPAQPAHATLGMGRTSRLLGLGPQPLADVVRDLASEPMP